MCGTLPAQQPAREIAKLAFQRVGSLMPDQHPSHDKASIMLASENGPLSGVRTETGSVSVRALAIMRHFDGQKLVRCESDAGSIGFQPRPTFLHSLHQSLCAADRNQVVPIQNNDFVPF